MSATPAPSDHRANRLLAALPPEEYAALAPHLEFVDLALDDPIHEPGAPIRAVLFPLTGVASQFVATAEGELIEVGTIGREGLVGLSAFHRADGGPLRALAQIPGTFLRLPAATLHERAAPGTALNAPLHRYSQAFYTLAAQSAGCNRLHPLEERAMPNRLPITEPAPHAAITAALAQIAAAYPALHFADERATEEAGEGFRRAVRLVQYQLRRALASPAPPPPPHVS